MKHLLNKTLPMFLHIKRVAAVGKKLINPPIYVIPAFQFGLRHVTSHGGAPSMQIICRQHGFLCS
jgi:hypothetical protein